MGLTSEINESKKINLDLFFSNSEYSRDYKLVSYLKNDIFKTLLVTTNKTKEYESGIPFVIKLYPIQNQKILSKYSEEFKSLKENYSNIESTPNILPIIKVESLMAANSGIVIRQYIKYNLKQALYYLACTSDIEKKWICFQLLQGLSQMHLKDICHGDIKPENILITSKLSVFYSDISVYKPVYLIIENLQLYNDFFYCNSFDRACYLAPERFVHNLDETDKNNNINELTKEMDIFSLGVVFAEIFLDRQNLFTQKDIMNYKNKKIDIKEKLNDIKDKNLRKVIKNMIELDPAKRKDLSDLIKIFIKEICPSPISTFIYHINLMIINYGYYKNDLLAALIHKHFIQIWKCLCYNDKTMEKMEIPKLKKKLNKYLILELLNNKYNIYKIPKKILKLAFDDENNKKDIFIEKEINTDILNINSYITDKSECSIIIIKYLISCLENLKYISTYFSIFEMIYNLSKILIKNKNQNVIIDLIIPNYIGLFKLNNSKLSIEVFNCIIDILYLINYEEIVLSKIDYNYFNNYVFEEIYKIYLNTEIFELKCAIISRLDEIIELENNFLLAYLNSYNNIINKEKDKENNNLIDIQDYPSLLSDTYLFDKRIKESKIENKNIKDNKDNIDFNYVRESYLNDLNSFKKKLKDIVKKTLEDVNNTNDALKLLIIQKYKEICLFCGSYNDNEQLFNHLFM